MYCCGSILGVGGRRDVEIEWQGGAVKYEGDYSRERHSVSLSHALPRCPTAFKMQFAGQSTACHLNKERDYHNYGLLSYSQEHFLGPLHMLLKPVNPVLFLILFHVLFLGTTSHI